MVGAQTLPSAPKVETAARTSLKEYFAEALSGISGETGAFHQVVPFPISDYDVQIVRILAEDRLELVDKAAFGYALVIKNELAQSTLIRDTDDERAHQHVRLISPWYALEYMRPQLKDPQKAKALLTEARATLTSADDCANLLKKP